MPNLMIVGFKEELSGKTTIARAFLRYFLDSGIDAIGFKPLSGNNIWKHYDQVCNTLKEGRLYSNDAKLLNNELIDKIDKDRQPINEELINPVHRLWNEPALIDQLTGIPNFVVDRITLFDGNHQRTVLLDNKTTSFEYIDKEKFLKNLNGKADDIFNIENIETFNTLVKYYYDSAINSTYDKIKRDFSLVIIESYGDIALPWDSSFKELDLVIGVEPWNIYVYEPEKYLDAVEITTLSHFKEVSTNQIKDLIRPIKKAKYKPVISGKRIDAIKKIASDLFRDIGFVNL
ncbi:MAG TPA: hypothetical protein HA221_02760 [Halobacteria archaeon]|nr:hypothetical protein [Halobacteria archaeon]